MTPGLDGWWLVAAGLCLIAGVLVTLAILGWKGYPPEEQGRVIRGRFGGRR